jgi:ribosome-binding factor A
MIGSTLQQELMSIIMRELNDPRLTGMPSITRVKVAEDLGTADVYVTIMGTEGKQTAALNALKHSAGMMRQKLQKTLPMRTIPYLKFQMDENLKKELSVLELIGKAVAEEDQLKASREPTASAPADSGLSDPQTPTNTDSNNPT